MEKDYSPQRAPCDTITVKEFINTNFPSGTYLVETDRQSVYQKPRAAVLYPYPDNHYILALIAKSKPGERFIETKNVIGFESSFINLDSTKLGTAFFYLILLECDLNNYIKVVWEAAVPSHGGFNSIKLKKWMPQNIEYIQLNFEDGIISGHRNYNYFLINGISSKPHLLETYEGIQLEREMADLNSDSYPDFVESKFSLTKDGLREVSKISFIWDQEKKIYRSTYNKRWTRQY